MNYNMSRSAAARRPRRRGFVVREARQIRLLGSPLRQALVDAIASTGPSTVATLSGLLGKPMDRLYYHLRLLERAGLVVARNVTPGVGRRDTEFDVPGRPIYLRYDLRSAASRRAVGGAVASIWRAARADFARGLRDPGAVVSGSGRNLWSGRVQGRLSAAELAEVNRLLHEIIAITSTVRAPRPGKRLLQFTWALSPCEAA